MRGVEILGAKNEEAERCVRRIVNLGITVPG